MLLALIIKSLSSRIEGEGLANRCDVIVFVGKLKIELDMTGYGYSNNAMTYVCMYVYVRVRVQCMHSAVRYSTYVSYTMNPCVCMYVRTCRCTYTVHSALVHTYTMKAGEHQPLPDV